MNYDKDLQSIQEARDMMNRAVIAQKELQNYSQEQVDRLVKDISDACAAQAEMLANMATEETGFGKPCDKVLKNILGSTMTYEYIKDMKTVGIIGEDKANKVIEIAVPLGVVVALIPSTNPTSTTIYKALISLKSGNAIIISPHPGAKNCITKTYEIILNAARKAGAPEHIVQCVMTPTLQATEVLMKHRNTGVILATGGEAMVRAAYSSGNPALGVGPGNGPAFIERSADVREAVRHIVESKTFDNGTICASEQSVVTERCMEEKVIEEMQRQGCYFLTPEESNQVGKIIMRANNTMNPAIVGRSVERICEMTGITVPTGTKILVSKQREIGHNNPYSREKLCPILGFYTAENWEDACEICMKLLFNEGAGHTMTIHSQDDHVIREFALKKPVSRLLVNTAASLGGVGATTGLAPALTLGCGAVGGSATSDNVSPLNLIDIRRVAYGTIELDSIRKGCSQGTQKQHMFTEKRSSDRPDLSHSGRMLSSGNEQSPIYAGNPSVRIVSPAYAGNPKMETTKRPAYQGNPVFERPIKRQEQQDTISADEVSKITKEVLNNILSNNI